MVHDYPIWIQALTSTIGVSGAFLAFYYLSKGTKPTLRAYFLLGTAAFLFTALLQVFCHRAWQSTLFIASINAILALIMLRLVLRFSVKPSDSPSRPMGDNQPHHPMRIWHRVFTGVCALFFLLAPITLWYPIYWDAAFSVRDFTLWWLLLISLFSLSCAHCCVVVTIKGKYPTYLVRALNVFSANLRRRQEPSIHPTSLLNPLSKKIRIFLSILMAIALIASIIAVYEAAYASALLCLGIALMLTLPIDSHSLNSEAKEVLTSNLLREILGWLGLAMALFGTIQIL